METVVLLGNIYYYYELSLLIFFNIGSLSLLISFACLIKLRISKPEMPRPFKIPFSIVGLSYHFNMIVFFIIIIIFIVIVYYYSIWFKKRYVTIVGVGISVYNVVAADHIAQVGGGVMAVVGIILYYSATYFKEKAK